jgi:hypothetical protein
MPSGLFFRRTWWITWKGNEGINFIDSKLMKFMSTRSNESKNSVLHWNKLVIRNELLL